MSEMIDGAIDGAINNPDRDLLGMKPYARKLAEQIAVQPTSLTVGIYGEWGSGKTSFVQLVSHYLSQVTSREVVFVEFSAWKYKTADEIWRALLIEIARKLCGVGTSESQPAPVGMWQRILRALRSEAIALRDGTSDSPDDGLREFNDLAEQLGMFTERIGHAASPSRLDPEAFAAALAKASMVAAGAAVPWFGRVREGLGIEAKLKPEQLLRGGELTAERVASTQAFLRTFKDLLERRAKGKRVCVFVDDLDRCMPDTALDVLEAIKLYLGDARCAFIVAADQQLIAHGLQLRFRGIGAGKDEADWHAKGREYFEKIIQLGIPVPHRTYKDIHDLVSGQFPDWASATDIIHATVGNNPRRVKQYCAWLSYRHAVVRAYQEVQTREQALDPAVSGAFRAARMREDAADTGSSAQASRAPGPPYELFRKLIGLRTWRHGCARELVGLAEHELSVEAYAALVKQLEEALRERDRATQDQALRARLTKPGARATEVVLDAAVRKRAVEAIDRDLRGKLDARVQRLYDYATKSTPAFELISDTTPPTLSLESPDRVITLFRLAAIRPARSAAAQRDRMLTLDGPDDPAFKDSDPGDPAFELIANKAAVSDARDLMIDHLARWISLLRNHPAVAQAVADLANRPSAVRSAVSDVEWRSQLVLLESGLANRRTPDAKKLCTEASELWKLIGEGAAAKEAAAKEFLDPRRPRLSIMHRLEITAFAMLNRLDQLPKPIQNIWTEQDADRATAAAVIDASAPGWTAPDGFLAAKAAALAELQLRVDVAEQMLERRSFAKLDALNSIWRELGQLMLTDRAAVNELENSALASSDSALRHRLLRLRPRFSEIPDSLISHYYQMALESAPASGAPPSFMTGERPAGDTGPVAASAPTSASSPALAVTTTPGVTATPAITTTPADSTTPAIATTPGVTATPAVTTTPADSTTPAVTTTPTVTSTPTVSPTPAAIAISAVSGRPGYPHVVTVEVVPIGNFRQMVKLTHNGETTAESVQLDLDTMERYAEQLKDVMVIPAGGDVRPARRDIVGYEDHDPDRRALLQTIGTWAYQQIFSGANDARLRRLQQSEQSLRLAWKWNPDLAFLPWETLYVPPVGPFMGLNRKVSLVRYHPTGVVGSFSSIRQPMRMLAVLTSPPGAPPLAVAREAALLEQMIGGDPRVRLELLTDDTVDKPTINNIIDRLNDFEPHVFHLVAHGFHEGTSYYEGRSKRGLLLLSSPLGGGEVVSSEQLAPYLGPQGTGRTSVQLAVLNACDTGRSKFGDSVSGIAGDMVAAGLPAAIATTRKVLDSSAILFTREFYRALLGGHSLETALVGARLALNANDWDWSAYTLVTSTADLDAFTLGQPPLLLRRGADASR